MSEPIEHLSKYVEIISSGHPQRTLKEHIKFTGPSLHLTGFSEIIVEPAPEDYGIQFSYGKKSGSSKPDFVYCGDHTGSVLLDEQRILGVEHLLSAFHGLGITNAHIRLLRNHELPLGDGSAQFFTKRFLDVGLYDQSSFVNSIKIKKRIFASFDKYKFIIAEPCEGFAVEAEIDHTPAVIGKQRFSVEMNFQTYISEIAPARTFIRDSIDKVSLKEAKNSRLKGLDITNVKHGPVIIYSDTEYLTELRFPNEPVRHKILDFIGDIYTLGLPIKGNFILSRPGHDLNYKFCKLIASLI